MLYDLAFSTKLSVLTLYNVMFTYLQQLNALVHYSSKTV